MFQLYVFAWPYPIVWHHGSRLNLKSSWKEHCRYLHIYIYIYIYIRGGTVRVFVPNHRGTDLSLVHEALRREQAIHPQSRSNATLFDNRQHQQKNRECHELHAWKQSPLDSDHVLILNASLTWTDKSFSHGLARALCSCSLLLLFGTNPNYP